MLLGLFISQIKELLNVLCPFITPSLVCRVEQANLRGQTATEKEVLSVSSTVNTRTQYLSFKALLEHLGDDLV